MILLLLHLEIVNLQNTFVFFFIMLFQNSKILYFLNNNTSTLFQFSKSSEILKTTFQNPPNLISNPISKNSILLFLAIEKLHFGKITFHLAKWQHVSPLKFGLYFGSQNNFVMSKLEISLLDSSSDEEISEIVEKNKPKPKSPSKHRGSYGCVTCGKEDFGHT